MARSCRVGQARNACYRLSHGESCVSNRFFDVAFDANMPLKNLFPERKDEKKAGGD
jgi:hypothetical protein